MSTLITQENSVPESGGNVEEKPITVHFKDVPPLTLSSFYHLEVDISAIDPLNNLDRGSIANARVCTLCAPTLLAFSHAFFIIL